MEKILFHNYIFSGGAPKTTLEYSKIAKKKYEIISIGETKENNKILDLYENENIDIINLESFKLNNIFKNFFILLKYIKYIKTIKPNLIFSTTIMNNFIDNIIYKCTEIPVVYLISGSVLKSFLIKTMAEITEESDIIVLSNELENSFREYYKKYIHNIPNRISFPLIRDHNTSQIYKEKVKVVKGVVTGRLSEDKKSSIKYLMKLTEQLNVESYPFELTIVGEGSNFSELSELAEEINNKLDGILIKLIGYSSDVNKIIENSHIVFGKGRSVLEGVFTDRISIVVNESKKSYLINENSFPILFESNMTGRNLESLSSFELDIFTYKNIINKIQKSQVNYNRLQDLNELVKKSYDINEKSEEILYIFNENLKKSKNINYNISYLKIFFEYIRLYLRVIKNYFKLKVVKSC